MQKLAVENDPANRVIKFWSAANPDSWPRAASHNACIFEAIQCAGVAKHGPSWDGSEFDAVNWLESPQAEFEKAMAMAVAEAERQRRQPKPFTPAASVRAGSGGMVRPLSLADFKLPHSDHVRAWHLEKREAHWRRNMGARMRLADTVEWLAQRCRDGELPSYARPREGGALWPITAWEWNIENVLVDFVSNGGMKRYFPELKMTLDAYIFFNKADLERVTVALAHASIRVAEVDLSRLSPYLRLAVSLALAKGYDSPLTAETQPIREAEIRAAWANAMPRIPMSDTAIQAIAKVLGFPNPKAILQGKSAKSLGKG